MPGNSPHYGRWPQHDFTSLKKLRPQSVTSRIQPGSDVIVCAEMDEQWGYVGAMSGLNRASAGCFTRMTGSGRWLLRTYSVNALWRRWGVL
ncbi:transposase for IS629 (plasmid) [Escherichia coli B7A]|nr:transposase for IS629 [Escherichia coli B7A]